MNKVKKTYSKQQDNYDAENIEKLEDLKKLSNNWTNSLIPKKQKKVIDIQLANLSKNIVDDVFVSLIETLNKLPIIESSILDCACASGYYFDLLSTQLNKKFKYTGSDYSEGMIKLAKDKYPTLPFSVQDITNLSFDKNEFNIVLVSGVLEHIPNFHDAISEVCRVAENSVIIHRCLLSKTENNIYTSGFLYNIKTPRIFYSKSFLENEFNKYGFVLDLEVPAFNRELKLITFIKNVLRTIFYKRRPRTEYTLTFTKTTA
jgi:ubiquinone/menaquinone biosynthesis C-methylase UbiE